MLLLCLVQALSFSLCLLYDGLDRISWGSPRVPTFHPEDEVFAETRRVFEAYHEAGHAVVGHVIGRCIERLALSTGEKGYRGYCRFHLMIEDANGHPEWRDDLGNPDLVTIYYAGMLATAYFCSLYVTLYEEDSCVEYPEGSERDDLEQIQKILAQIGADKQQRATITDASWKQ